MRLTIAAFFLTLLVAAPARAQDPKTPAVAAVERFYTAFAASDFSTMESLYAPSVHWQDTIFTADGRDRLMGIWRFELDPKVGGKVTWQVVSAAAPDESGATKVRVRWRDVYKFFGNPIDHQIDATLTVDKDGKITRHIEQYSWSEWAHQAFPWLGSAVDNPVVGPVMRWFLRKGVGLKVWLDGVERDRTGAPRESRRGVTDVLEREVETETRAER